MSCFEMISADDLYPRKFVSHFHLNVSNSSSKAKSSEDTSVSDTFLRSLMKRGNLPNSLNLRPQRRYLEKFRAYVHFPEDLISLAATFPLIPYQTCKVHFHCDCNRAIDVQAQFHPALLIERVRSYAPRARDANTPSAQHFRVSVMRIKQVESLESGDV